MISRGFKPDKTFTKKVKVTLEEEMKTRNRRRRIALLFL